MKIYPKDTTLQQLDEIDELLSGLQYSQLIAQLGLAPNIGLIRQALELITNKVEDSDV